MSTLAPRWVAVGGGGYETGAVARCWTLAYGVMAGKDFPDEIPRSFRERYGIEALRDAVEVSPDSESRERARSFAEEGVREIERTVFPLHGLGKS